MATTSGQTAPGRSLLDRVGEGFLTAASSLDANIDASALVDRLSAADADVTGRKVHQALSDLKELVRRAPNAVVATQGAVSALLRVLNKLGRYLGQDKEIDLEEALQDGLETLGLLLEVKKEASGSAGERHRRKGQDDFSVQRSAEVAEITIRHTEKGKDLLKLLSARSVSTRFDVMVVLQRVYQQQPSAINSALLADPISLNRLMEILQDCSIDYVRNETLGLLLLLTTGSAEIRQIVTMQGLAETIFSLLAEEELGAGGKVPRDLLHCLKNLAADAVCQRCIRETGGLSALVATMDAALSGKKPNGEEEEATEDEDDEFSSIQRIQLEVSPEARWACFLLLAQVGLAFLAPAAAQGASESGGTSDAEIPANRDVLIRNNVLVLLYRLKDPRVGTDAKMHLILLLEALIASPLVAKRLEEESTLSGEPATLLSALMGILLGPGPPLEVQSALGRVLCRGITLHSSLQHAMLADLSPQLDLGEPGPPSSMRKIVSTLERAAVGIVEPLALWFSFHLLVAMVFGNPSIQAALATMRIAFPGGDEPAEFCLDLCLMAFSGCARRCLHGSGGGEENDDNDQEEHLDDAAGSATPDNPSFPAAGLLASLKFLVHWLSCCQPAVSALVESPVLLPLLIELQQLGDGQGRFFRTQIQGLSALLMGVCIKASQKDPDMPNLMALVAKKVGVEAYQHKLEALIRSDVLQRRTKSIATFRWHSGRDKTLFKDLQQAIMRSMVQIYIADSLSTDSNSLAEDVADQYKQLIRVQDEKFREVQHENEQLRQEVENFMSRSLKASSSVLTDKLDALQTENEALHEEVQSLEKEAATRALRSERELQSSRRKIAELESQRQSMLVSYDQLERAVDSLRKEAQELRSVQAASERAKGAGSELVLALAAEDAERQAEEYRKDRADLLELLNQIVQSVPQARHYVDSLGKTTKPDASSATVED